MSERTAGLDPEALYGLMTITEEQQKANAEVLQQLQGKLQALEAITARAGRHVRDLGSAGDAIVSQIQQSATASAREGTAALMSAVSTQAVASLEAAAHPLLQRLEDRVKAGVEVEGRLLSTASSLAWKSMAWWASGMAAACLVGLVSVWWSRHELADLQVQRDVLKDEVAQLTVSVEELAEKGGRLRMTRCGGRLCVEVASNQGTNVRVEGAWQGPDGRQYVIPRGY